MLETDGSYFSGLGIYSKAAFVLCIIVLVLTAGPVLNPLSDGSSQDSVTYEIRDQGDYVGEVTMTSSVDSTEPEVGSDTLTYNINIEYIAHPDQRAINPSISFMMGEGWKKDIIESIYLQPGDEESLQHTVSINKNGFGGKNRHPVDTRAYIEAVQPDPMPGYSEIHTTSHKITYRWPYWERFEPYVFMLSFLLISGIIVRPAVESTFQSWQRGREIMKKARTIAETLEEKTGKNISPPNWAEKNTQKAHSQITDYSECLDTILTLERQLSADADDMQIELSAYYTRLAESYMTDSPTLEEINRDLDAVRDLQRWSSEPFPTELVVASRTTDRKISFNEFVAQQCRTALVSGDPTQIQDTAATVVDLARQIAESFDKSGAYTDDYLFNNSKWICDPAVQKLQDAIKTKHLDEIRCTFSIVESIGALSDKLQSLDHNTRSHTSREIYDIVYEGIDHSDPDRIEEAIDQYNGQQALCELQSLLDDVEFGHGEAKTQHWRAEMRTAREDKDWERIITLKNTVAERAERQWALEDLLALSPSDFESLVANLWEKKGFQTRVTTQSNDRGVDVIARKGGNTSLIQAKRYDPEKSTVGGPTVREIAGALQERGADSCLVVTSGTFSEQAISSARSITGVELIGHKELISELNESALAPS